MPLLDVRNASKNYTTEGSPVAALSGVSMQAEAGEFIALVGRSGCGKTTLLNLCGAMDFPSSGEILIDGISTSKLSDSQLTRTRREKVGFIFQSFQLMNTLTALENVELPLLLARKPDTRGVALERLGWVEMDAFAARYPHQLSGGQQQRIAIARALAHTPRLLLADEPTGNLDTSTGDMVLKTLRRAALEFGVAIVMATHSAESTAASDRVLKMRDGRMEAN